MPVVKIIGSAIYCFVIVAILVRSTNEQSLQETVGQFDLFESTKSTENTIDKLVIILIISYFIFNILFINRF